MQKIWNLVVNPFIKTPLIYWFKELCERLKIIEMELAE